MYKRVEARIMLQFNEAARCGQCMRPASRNDRRALDRVAEDVSGLSPVAYRRAKREPKNYVSPMPGFYLLGSDWIDMDDYDVALQVIRAVASAHPDWTFCSYSAAVLHGLDVPWELLKGIHVLRQSSCGAHNSKYIHWHHAGALEVVRSNGVRFTDLRETVLACSCDASFELGLGIVDSALRQRRVTKEQLEVYFDVAGKGRRGISRARATLSYADGRSENGGESRARAVMIEEGFAPHELQVPFADPIDPFREMRGDYGWRLEDGTWVIGELDGRRKYEDPEMMNGEDIVGVLLRERQRESRMSAYGVRIMRFPFSYVVHREKLVYLMQTYGVPRSEIPRIP